jgi:predicted site-specific integrase-resolvase
MRIAEVMKWADCSEATVRRWMSEGHLAFFRIGGRVFIRTECLYRLFQVPDHDDVRTS